MKIPLKCKCGSVTGGVKAPATNIGTHIICYCKDCQKFPKSLGTADVVLDEYGGTDIFQVPISHLEIKAGNEHINCLRLTPKGMYRWYTDCCNTPIGNTMSSKWAFIGLIHSIIEADNNRDALPGPVYAHVNKLGATAPLPTDRNQTGSFIKVMSKILIWKLKGYHKPSAFFNDKGEPISEPKIL